MKEQSDTSYQNEAILVEALQQGKADAYAYIMDAYHHKLCLYAYSLSKDNQLARDIVQNVMLRLWKKRKGLLTDGNLRSFLYRSVYHEFLDQYRHRKFILNLEKEYMTALDRVVHEDESHLERLIQHVKKEIEELSPKCKEIFLLSKKEGLTHVEIADHLKISVKTVENQMSRAYAQIRKKVGEKLDGILFLLFHRPPMLEVR